MVNVKIEKMGNVEAVEINNNTGRDLSYVVDGVEIARGVGIVETVKDYLEGNLGLDLGNGYRWKEYPKNRDYEVSELGFIRRVGSDTVMNMSFKGEYEEGHKGVWRLRVSIPRVGTVKVSQIVADTFLGERPEGLVVGHKNDIPLDNRLSNLEYITDGVNRVYASVWDDLSTRLLGRELMTNIYFDIVDLLELKYGEDYIKIEELDDEEMEEVRDMYLDINEVNGEDKVSINKLTIGDIYRYFRRGDSVIRTLEDEGYITLK